MFRFFCFYGNFISAAWKTLSPIAGLIVNGINITNNSIKIAFNYHQGGEQINGQAETQGVGGQLKRGLDGHSDYQ